MSTRGGHAGSIWKGGHSVDWNNLLFYWLRGTVVEDFAAGLPETTISPCDSFRWRRSRMALTSTCRGRVPLLGGDREPGNGKGQHAGRGGGEQRSTPRWLPMCDLSSFPKKAETYMHVGKHCTHTVRRQKQKNQSSWLCLCLVSLWSLKTGS